MVVVRKRVKLQQNTGEQDVHLQLSKLGLQFEFEPHSFKYSVPATYTPDFVVHAKSGPIYVEVKGYHAGMQEWCSKIKHFKASHPHVDFRIVFLNAKKKFNKNYKSNLGDWATKNGIIWADNGIIPEEWFI
jgi:hypothetical protein